MSEKVRRPPTVWITQALLIIFLLLFLSILFDLFLLSSAPLKIPILSVRFISFMLIVFLLLATLIAAFWGLAKRKIYGKWLGLVSLSLIWGLIVYTQLFPSKGPYQRHGYDNAAQLAGAFFALSLIHVLFLTLILRLALSKKVNQFFQRETKAIAA
jgi:hypothetical protein